MSTIYSLNIILMFFIWFIKDSEGIQNVRLILPTIVQAGTSATLLCLYDLEGASLYSVQWYRGQFEFFRFIPNENPPFKVFQIPGLYVDSYASNEHQVTLRNIPVQLSGEFSCEITTDALPISTSCISDSLTVVDLKMDLKIPEKPNRFGDFIVANCTLQPTLISTKLVFHWNSKPVPEMYISRHFSYSVLQLNTTLYDNNLTYTIFHQLRCSALLDDTYYIISKSFSLQLEPSKSVAISNSGKLENIHSPIDFLLIIALMGQIFWYNCGL